MNDVWILAEHTNGVIKEVTYELLSWGRSLADELGKSLVSVLLSSHTSDEDLTSLIAMGSDSILYVEDDSLRYADCIRYSTVLKDLVEKEKPQIFLASATTTGRTIMPYLAVKIGSGLTADCTELSIEKESKLLLQTRPAIGGNIMATIKSPNHTPQMATLRPKSKKPLPRDTSRNGNIEKIDFDTTSIVSHVEVLGIEELVDDQGAIEEAAIVVSGGKGLKKKDNFVLIHQLAHLLGAKVGASREAVDRGWIGYSHQVGLSGKTISPELYMAIGISGAVQHLAGIKTASHIVSINSDKNEPIIQISDFALVGDLFVIIEELKRQLAQREVQDDSL
ncbi:MAG: electron transfer flavoprotein subunit alpha/FixB family protein [Spirochaetia bacterium]|nr:electron transfer flavoprotein subunit alpha/FixB family protein [Spirochaetia bacterium]